MKRLSGPLILGLRDAQAWFILGVLVLGYVVITTMTRLDGRPQDIREIDQSAGLAGCFFLAFGAAYAAIRVVELERSGRLDQLRLTGQPPERLLAAIVGASALPWLVAGIAFLIAAKWLDALQAGWWHSALPVILGNVAVAMLALALPASRHITDLRIVTVGAGAFSAVLSVMSTSNDIGFRALVASLHLNGATAALIAMTIEAVIVVACVSSLLKSIARPRPPRSGQSGLVRGQWLHSIPARFRRGFAISGIAAFALTAFATAMVALRAYFVPAGSEVGIVVALLPLLVGAVNVSSVARADADSRILDVLRLSGQPALISAIRITLELWLPFLISAALVLTVTAILANGVPFSAVASLTVAVVLIAPFALLEGWYRAMLLTYVIPLALIAFQFTPPGALITWQRFVPVLAVSWIGWAMVASILRRGVGSAFGWRLQCAALAAITLVGTRAASGITTESGLAFVLLLVSGWFSERDGNRSLTWILPAIVFSVTTAMALRYFWASWLSPVMLALLPAAAFAAGRRIDRLVHASIAPWSLALRILTGMAIVAWDGIGFSYMVDWAGGSTSYLVVRFAVRQLMMLTSLLLLAGITIAIEAGATIASRYRKPVTLPS